MLGSVSRASDLDLVFKPTLGIEITLKNFFRSFSFSSSSSEYIVKSWREVYDDLGIRRSKRS